MAINHSVLHGYRPVVTLDEDDDSLEIEARLGPDQLLLLHVQASGIVYGQMYSKSFGTKIIDRIKASDFLTGSSRKTASNHSVDVSSA